MQPNYKLTKFSCYGAIASQAVQNNLPPLLFVVFREQFGISYEMLGRLIVFNFLTQVIVDILSIKLAGKIGYKKCLVFGMICIALGLAAIGVLPQVMPAYLGLAIGVVLAAIGGGLSEVLVSPTVEALPGNEKAAAMSMLHSFYCWGQVVTVLFSTLLLFVIGDNVWWVLPLLWTVVPFGTALMFVKAPFAPIVAEEGKAMRLAQLLKQPVFLVAMLIMVCAGASELTMSQWASAFAEKGLQVSKVVGDLMGPCLFAVFMGMGRLLYGKMGSRLPLKKSLMFCGALCVVCYLVTVFSGNAFLALMGCAVCGLSVSLMWPGSLSMTAERFPLGGTAMFAILAMSGDVGCSVGPWLAGIVSDGVQTVPALAERAAFFGLTAEQLGLKAGILLGVVFPVILFIGTMIFKEPKKS